MNHWNPPPQKKIELGDNEIDIWLFHLNTLPQSIKHFYSLLADDEKERSEKFIHFMHRKRFISSHGFVRSVLANYLEQQPSELKFGKSEHGKPELDNITNTANIKFNLSHSHDMALVAVCKNNEIGVDIEYMDRKNNWSGIIKRFFTEPEQKNIFSLAENQQQAAFFQTWTRKEAHMKVTGLGLGLSPTRFTVSTPPEEAKLIDYPDYADNNPVPWSMSDIIMPGFASQYCACVSYHGLISRISHYLYK